MKGQGEAELLNSWAGRERRDPPITSENYLVLKPLSEAIACAFHKYVGGRNCLSLLDIGCGNRPYFPFFAPYVGRYVGVDLIAGEWVDYVCQADRLPFVDAEFDAVVCFQVLEHTEDPAKCLAEIFRVLKPGGFCLLSTHGVWYYHPEPKDFWRWTHEGLRRILEAAGFSTVEIMPNGGTISAVFCQISVYVHMALRDRPRWGWFRSWLIGALNRLAPRLETWVEPFQFPNVGYLAINYLVAAKKESLLQAETSCSGPE